MEVRRIKKVVANLTFKDDLLQFLEKRNYLEEPPTPEIQELVEFLRNWDPAKDSPLRYIMSTLADRGVRQFDNNFTELCKKVGLEKNDNLNDFFRIGRLASSTVPGAKRHKRKAGTDLETHSSSCQGNSTFHRGDTTALGGSSVP